MSRVYNTLLLANAILIISTAVLNIYWFQFDHIFGATSADSDCRKSLPAVGAERKVRQIINNATEQNARILVVYAGPSNKAAKNVELYRKNLDFFIKHGVECDTQDTVIVVGHEFYDEYVHKINKLNGRCHHKVILISRRDVCYDMEAARLAIYGGVPGIDIHSYDYFLFANCGTTGPAPKASYPGAKPWTSRFIDLLNDKVKMTGLVLNCEQPDSAHIMSMVYALDRTGLDIVLRSGAIFDCLDPPVKDFINKYERKMGKAILSAGYSLRPIIGPDMIVTDKNREDCKPCTTMEQKVTGMLCQKRAQYADVWIGSRLKAIYGGRLPSLDETVFFKTSRVFPEDIRQLVEWNRSIPVNWEWN